jgi:hypothetical protein
VRLSPKATNRVLPIRGDGAGVAGPAGPAGGSGVAGGGVTGVGVGCVGGGVLPFEQPPTAARTMTSRKDAATRMGQP